MTRRILVVEDEPDNRQIVRDLLIANEYELTEAETGEETLLAVAKNRPDLILMDIQLRSWTATRQRAGSRLTLRSTRYRSSRSRRMP